MLTNIVITSVVLLGFLAVFTWMWIVDEHRKSLEGVGPVVGIESVPGFPYGQVGVLVVSSFMVLAVASAYMRRRADGQRCHDNIHSAEVAVVSYGTIGEMKAVCDNEPSRTSVWTECACDCACSDCEN